jgi:3-dehydroquinate synthase
MIKLNINLGDRSYPIYITTDYTGLARSITSTRLSGRFVLVTDTNVDRFQSEECLQALQEAGLQVDKYVMEAGEKHKTLETVQKIYKYLLELKLERNSTLLALGGGVVGDITGFVAATFLRGINFIQIPTTSLAQADSSVGGKVGVDFEGSKNMIGAFYQPRLVYININTLRTLPRRELVSGLAEVVKHGIIRDADFFDFIDYNAKKIFNFDPDVLQYMAKVNCLIKGKVVEQDEKESDLRAILNFGHTIGHAIESTSGFELLHGECVSLGMAGACYLAKHLGMVDETLVDRVIQTLEKVGLPVRYSGIDVDRVYEQMFHDKKVKNNKLTFILPKSIGEVMQCNVEDTELIKKAIAGLA